MFEDEDEILPPPDEQVPERLAKKWDEREKREGVTSCRHCRKQILAASSFCAYCGEPLERGFLDLFIRPAPTRQFVILFSFLLLLFLFLMVLKMGMHS